MPTKKKKKVYETNPLLINPVDDDLTNEDILKILIDDGLIQRCVDYQFSKLTSRRKSSIADRSKKQYKEDFYHDLILIIADYNNEKLNNAYHNKHLNALITAIIVRQLYSTTSYFARTYVLPQHNSIDFTQFYADNERQFERNIVNDIITDIDTYY